MEENVFATSRNGHELKDMYDPETNTLDIRSNGLYPSNVLSNLCSNAFRYDGILCSSMEGFLQSLKQQDVDKQRQICSMKGGNARKRSVTFWQADQIVWWKGQPINRQSPEYFYLVREAYQAMFNQNERFRTALMQTRGMNLAHTTGENDTFKTILTPREFCGILEEMRWEYDQHLTEKGKITIASVQDCKTRLKKEAFSGFEGSIQHISISETVKRIYGFAFDGCSSLEDVFISADVTRIKRNAFNGCKMLKRIDVSADNIFFTSIDGILYDKECRTLVRVPQAYEEKVIHIPAGIKRIEAYAFEGCSVIEKVIIAESVRAIGRCAFSGCSSLTAIRMDSKVITIREKTFEGCTSLKSISIPNGVWKIEDYAFLDCSSLENVFLPESVNRMGHCPFLRCSSLSNICVDSKNSNYYSIDGALFYCGCTILQCHIMVFWRTLMVVPKKLVSYYIPPSTIMIDEKAFDSCYYLKELIISESVSRINCSFEDCISLRSLHFMHPSLKNVDIGYHTIDSINKDCVIHVSEMCEFGFFNKRLCRFKIVEE